MSGATPTFPAIASYESARRRPKTGGLNDWRVSAYSLIVVSVLLIVFSSLAHADDLTGLSDNDPKDLMPAPHQTAPRCAASGDLTFQPLPTWAHGVIMPPLPYQLTPMGRKPVSFTAAAPAPAPPAPPKEAPASTTTASASAPKPAPAPENPALISVSPFLQWIKANPQAAAAEAHQQANGYHPAPNGGPGAPGAPVGAPGAEDPYWLPPLIDSSTFSTSTGPGGSAAIYSTPQR